MTKKLLGCQVIFQMLKWGNSLKNHWFLKGWDRFMEFKDLWFDDRGLSALY